MVNLEGWFVSLFKVIKSMQFNMVGFFLIGNACAWCLSKETKIQKQFCFFQEELKNGIKEEGKKRSDVQIDCQCRSINSD